MPPGVTARERGEERADQRLPALRPPRRVLTAPGRGDVRDLGQPARAQVVVVLAEVHDVTRQPPSSEPRHVEKRNADALCAGGGTVPVVVLDVEPPRDAAALE